VPIELPRGAEWWRDKPGGTDWLGRLPLLASECAEEWTLQLGVTFDPATISLVGDSVHEDVVACARWLAAVR
jgi:hypothetical protein